MSIERLSDATLNVTLAAYTERKTIHANNVHAAWRRSATTASMSL